MRLFVAVVAVAILSACATPTEPASTGASAALAAPATPPAAAVQVADNKKTCRRMPVTGSNMSKRVCSTAEEWATFDSQGREGVDEFDRQRGNNGSVDGGGERLQ